MPGGARQGPAGSSGSWGRGEHPANPGGCTEQVPAGLAPHEVSALPPQLALLYEEVLYTIRHRLGKPEHHHVADVRELYAYVQKVGPHLPNGVPKTCPLTCLPSRLKEMGGTWREFLTGTLKDVAVASSWRAGTTCSWEILALRRNIYLRLGMVGRRLSLKSFQLVLSPSAGLFAPLLSP